MTTDYRDKVFNLEGVELAYPTFFRDGSSAMGIFAVSAKVADEIIADSGFKTARIAPGTAALSLVCVHYTDTDCGSYEEIALAFFVKKHGRQARKTIPYLSTWRDVAKGEIASYTWCLPVSSTLSRDCGIFMWGFPKTLETIEYGIQNGRASSTWSIDGQKVLSYSVPARGDQDMARVAPPVYSLMEGKHHVSYLAQSYTQSGRHGRDGQLELGTHPAAERLKRLGLPKKPLVAMWNGHLEFEMSHPEEL
jgi:Acetoacetate decarboxylase (ADC)